MKNKYRNEWKMIQYILSTERYKFIFILSILLSLYGGFVLGVPRENFIDSLLKPFTFYFFSIFFFALAFINNMNVCAILKEDFPYYVLRLKTKKEYVKMVIRLSIMLFFICFIVVLAFLLMCLFLTTFHNIEISPYKTYSITNLSYCLFHFLRYFLYGMLLIVISSLLYVNTNTKIVIGYAALILAFIFVNNVSISFVNIAPYFATSYFSQVNFPSFSIEVIWSLGILIALEVIVLLLYRITIKNKRIEVL